MVHDLVFVLALLEFWTAMLDHLRRNLSLYVWIYYVWAFSHVSRFPADWELFYP